MPRGSYRSATSLTHHTTHVGSGATNADAPPDTHPLTESQRRVVEHLAEVGGCIHYTLLTRWAASTLPAWGSGILKSLERRGLVRIHRKWGAWDYGQPGLIELTEAGRHVAKTLL
jgi:hypothetical protein